MILRGSQPADRFKLTLAERNERIQCGETRFKNGVRGASTYMNKALLLDSARKVRITITSGSLVLLARVKTCSPWSFENLVLDVLVAMGYRVSVWQVESA